MGQPISRCQSTAHALIAERPLVKGCQLVSKLVASFSPPLPPTKRTPPLSAWCGFNITVLSILSLPPDSRNTRLWASSKLPEIVKGGDLVAQFLMSWLLVGGRFRIYAINGIGRRKSRVIEVEVIATGERFHGSARRMERLVRALQGSDDDRRHDQARPLSGRRSV